jgi:hypothetical protein
MFERLSIYDLTRALDICAFGSKHIIIATHNKAKLELVRTGDAGPSVRWAMLLKWFNFNIKCVLGKSKKLLDAFSR